MCKIFVIEGPDYSGKTTLVNALLKHFKFNGKKATVFKEPSGQIRDMLLDKDGDLSFAARRNLFAADHIQTLKSIYGIRNKYDYIIMDRSTVISDLIYAPFETDNNYMCLKIMEQMREQFNLIDKAEYEDFFRCNTHLILLKLSKQELLNRMCSRSVNKNDIFDIKSDDFKILVWESYGKLINTLMTDDYPLVNRLFCSISSIEVDNNLINNTIRIMESEE